MRKSPFLYTLLTLAMFSALIYGCKKVNGIDNGQGIATPYTLYFTDSSGALYNTNDGKVIQKLAFPSDGSPIRALCLTSNTILVAKSNIYVSADNGVNFNHAFDSVAIDSQHAACNGMTLDLNQSLMINMDNWSDRGRIYACSWAIGDNIATDYLGVAHSDSFGIRGTWAYSADGYDTASGSVGILSNTKMRSLTRLQCGILCGLADDSAQHYGTGVPNAAGIYNHLDPLGSGATGTPLRNFYKTCRDDGSCPWKEVTGNPPPGYNANLLTLANQSGSPLPPSPSYPQGGFFSLGHYNNRLIAIDGSCHYGAFYSDDTGRNWIQCTGLPLNTPMLCISSPFEQICLIGTGNGLYTYNNHTNTFVPNNGGLPANVIVRGIAAKQNTMKNGNIQKYIFLTTNKGLFQSVDGGYNWVLVFPGNFVSAY